MSWAEVVTDGLDDSRDGINLMIKQTLNVNAAHSLELVPEGDEPVENKGACEQPKENVFMKKLREDGVLKKAERKKGATFKAALLQKTDDDGDEELCPEQNFQATSNGFSSRKRLACAITTTPIKGIAPRVKAKQDQKKGKGQDDSMQPHKLNFFAKEENGGSAPSVKRIGSGKKVITKKITKSKKSWADFDDDVSSASETEETEATEKQPIEELTEERIIKRQKQIDFGKATEGYMNYLAKVPKNKRKPDPVRYPRTPDRTEHISKRSWDYKVRRWRRLLHNWDINPGQNQPKKSQKRKG
mmetsp:Transcript_38949/g.62751  ORF Transcript_38949/g.62751 Transcript_38949/m.62751 type:complete len:301 (-) Transcript_38949:2029-2931(-)